jgi:hypothetical protein
VGRFPVNCGRLQNLGGRVDEEKITAAPRPPKRLARRRMRRRRSLFNRGDLGWGRIQGLRSASPLPASVGEEAGPSPASRAWKSSHAWKWPPPQWRCPMNGGCLRASRRRTNKENVTAATQHRPTGGGSQ